VSRLPTEIRLTYIGLWCVADDAGWLAWDVSDLGAQLYPYESVRVRERRLTASGEALVGAGRMYLHPCGCAFIPTLSVHQKIGGNKSFTARDRHDKHRSPNKSRHSRTNPPVGSELVSELVTGASAREDDDAYRAGVIESFRKQGLPVDS
jgi:hypothetical protein